MFTTMCPGLVPWLYIYIHIYIYMKARVSGADVVFGKTLKKLARTTEFHITPLGSLKTIYVYSLETVKQIIIMRAYYFNCTLPKWGVFFNRL